MAESEKRRLGVFICHCGGNVSDYVDVNRVVAAVAKDEGVIIAKTNMFTCSDAAQQEMIAAIQENSLDGIVIASCSPKLHMFTFRGMAERAGINPYRYVQVNLREQCSWAHTDKREGATRKGIRLVRAGIAKCRLTTSLEPFRVATKSGALVIGGGAAGLRAALALADIGIQVSLVEKEKVLGGWASRWKAQYPAKNNKKEIVQALINKVQSNERIRAFMLAKLKSKSGNLGDFKVEIETQDGIKELNVGAILVTTGAETYKPRQGEFGHGLPNVVTLEQFKDMLEESTEGLVCNGREVKNVVYIYCVGSRQKKSDKNAHPNTYCSRYCCGSACHTAIDASEKFPEITQYHLFRDVRTYGESELLFDEARNKDSVFIRYDEKDPPVVGEQNGIVTVKVKDQLTGNRELEISADLVVLVTGLVPRKNKEIVDVLKLPLEQSGFFREIHVKLRPVETVIDGVFIAGGAQSPKSIAESVASSLAAVSKAGAMLLKGHVDLEPLVAQVDADKCAWCGACEKVCPYNAIQKNLCNGKETAIILPTSCKGCGACAPVCEQDAISVKGYTDQQITSMIDAMSVETA